MAMQVETPRIFFSYARADAEFALKLARDLRSAGTNLWLDQLDIPAGTRWDRAVEEALKTCPCILVILSPASVISNNVMDEVSFGLEEDKKIVPVHYRDCDIPFRLKRIQYIDFTADYDNGVTQLLKTLNIVQPAQTLEIPEAAKQASHPVREAKSNTGTSNHPADLGQGIWIPAFLIVIGWAVSGAIGLTIIFNIVITTRGSPGAAFGAAIGWAVSGAIGGFVTGRALHSIEPSIRWPQAGMFAFGCAVGGAIGGALSWSLPSVIGGFIGGSIGGGICGLTIGYGLQSVRAPIRQIKVSMCAFAWAIGGGLGGALSWAFQGYEYNSGFYMMVGLITGGTIGAVGGGLMLWWLSYERTTP